MKNLDTSSLQFISRLFRKLIVLFAIVFLKDCRGQCWPWNFGACPDQITYKSLHTLDTSVCHIGQDPSSRAGKLPESKASQRNPVYRASPWPTCAIQSPPPLGNSCQPYHNKVSEGIPTTPKQSCSPYTTPVLKRNGNKIQFGNFFICVNGSIILKLILNNLC